MILPVKTHSRTEMIDITDDVQAALREAGVRDGFCMVFVPHTTAAVTINENADPTVRDDFEAYFDRAVPENEPYFLHATEGPDDMPAHIRSIITHADLNLPIRNGRCDLGTWQGVYLWEHRHHVGSRQVVVHL